MIRAYHGLPVRYQLVLVLLVLWRCYVAFVNWPVLDPLTGYDDTGGGITYAQPDYKEGIAMDYEIVSTASRGTR